jgi:hypothetical protein
MLATENRAERNVPPDENRPSRSQFSNPLLEEDYWFGIGKHWLREGGII